MHIYRCITQQEVLNKFKNVDKELKTIRGANTHTYQKDLSYIHFFRYKKFAQYYFNTNSSFFNPFILYMTASIPDNVLKQFLGYGYYSYFDNDYNGTMLLPEYAIPKDLFKLEYIKEINTYLNNFDNENNIEYKKYLIIVKKIIKENNYNINKVAKYLKQTDLDELLNNNDQKKIIKIFEPAKNSNLGN